MKWQVVMDNVWVFRDSCNVYAVHGPEGVVVIDAGSGIWLDHIEELPGKPAAVLCTHHLRDHSAGASKAAARGIAIFVPEYEHAIFTDPHQHFRERQSYITYENLWDFDAPIEAASEAQPFLDYETRAIAGIAIEAIPLPGATVGQTGYAMTVQGKSIVFCGETIHTPGRVARIAPLQYNYNDMPGVLNVILSSRTLRGRKVDALLPSLGQPILDDSNAALTLLESNLKKFLEAFGRQLNEVLEQLDRPTLEQVTEHVWYSTVSGAVTWFLLSRDKKQVMAIDYGYDWQRLTWPGEAQPKKRRAILHSIDELRERFGIERIDTVLVSHFHDDHVNMIPLLQRLHGTQCWASDVFADLIEQPEAHCFPCNWPIACKVDKRFGVDQTVTWDQYTFNFAPMSGHTRFSTLIGFVADGKRFAHTGDQVFFRSFTGDTKEPDRFLHNHVYRNGALLDGMAQTAQWLDQWKPDIIITGHTPPIEMNEARFESVRKAADEYANMHKLVMPLDDDDTHFNLDSCAGWLWPYRSHQRTAGPVHLRATVRNPLPTDATVRLRIVGPAAWRCEAVEFEIGPRQEKSQELTLHPMGTARRQPIALEMWVNGRPFGQITEALVTIGHDKF